MVLVMDSLLSKELLVLVSMLLFLISGVATILFSRISVSYIERKIREEESSLPEWDKGIGIRLTIYASVILFPNRKRYRSPIDIEKTKRYARKRDYYLALFFELSMVIFIVTSIITYMLYGNEFG